MRCIEIAAIKRRCDARTWLIETWDVLKLCDVCPPLERHERLIETWDVLKWYSKTFPSFTAFWLIETWDVLKSNFINGSYKSNEINRNMRCIEIVSCHSLSDFAAMINRNMRCIEMVETWTFRMGNTGLIETWDVLKFAITSPTSGELTD